jgi:hypothetical protein
MWLYRSFGSEDRARLQPWKMRLIVLSCTKISHWIEKKMKSLDNDSISLMKLLLRVFAMEQLLGLVVRCDCENACRNWTILSFFLSFFFFFFCVQYKFFCVMASHSYVVLQRFLLYFLRLFFAPRKMFTFGPTSQYFYFWTVKSLRLKIRRHSFLKKVKLCTKVP